MKQIMRLKALNQCGKNAEEYVSSAKVTTLDFETIRCTNIIFKQRSMNQHENDLNPGPMTETGFQGGSGRQVNLPGANRMPAMSSVKVRSRVTPNSCFSLYRLGFLVQGDYVHKKRKHILKKHTGSHAFRYPGISQPGVSECVDTTEFRRQSHWLAICLEKTCDIALKGHLCSFTQSYGASCIKLCRCGWVSYEVVYRHSGMIASKQTGILRSCKTPSRWRKTTQMEQQIMLSNWWKYPVHTSIGILNNHSKN